MSHPAQWSPEILAVIAPLIPQGTRVHDPFAGTGERLGQTADAYAWIFTGTEIEAPFIIDPRVSHGDSCDSWTYPAAGYSIVTSPVYPNGIADDFAASKTKRRRTYRAGRAEIVGRDEPLHPHNQGRWGYRGTPAHSVARAMYWHLAEKVVTNWTGAATAFVNVSDFIAGDYREHVVGPWARLLKRHGWKVVDLLDVVTPRYRDGSNADSRVEAETVIVCTRKV